MVSSKVHFNKQESKKKSKIQSAIDEILKTEADYLADLRHMINALITPLRNSNVLSARKIDTLFMNLAQIAELTECIVECVANEITAQENPLAAIDCVFHRVASSIANVYSRYVAGFEDSKELQQKLKKNGKYIPFRKQLEGCGFSFAELNNLLIKPIQRTPRYIMLLEALGPSCARSLSDLQNSCSYINSQEHTTSCQQQLKELGLAGKLSASRMFHNGKLLKKGNTRTFYLFDTALVQTRSSSKIFGTKVIAIDETLQIEDIDNTTFKISLAHKTLKLTCNNAASKALWISSLTQCRKNLDDNLSSESSCSFSSEPESLSQEDVYRAAPPTPRMKKQFKNLLETWNARADAEN